METTTIILLCAFATLAGFVDAIVGGGGLIQTPAALIMLPNLPVSTVIGSLKIKNYKCWRRSLGKQSECISSILSSHWRLRVINC